MKNNKLTNKQEAILIFIKKYIAKNSYPPTVREIAAAVNLSSPATVHVHLSNLIEKGFIKRNKKNHRILELLVPNEFEQIINNEINITLLQNNKKNTTFKILKNSINKHSEVIAFKMDNDKLQSKGILKEDILIFECCNNCEDNDIILFHVNNTYLVGTKELDTHKVNIIGRLIKLYREY